MTTATKIHPEPSRRAYKPCHECGRAVGPLKRMMIPMAFNPRTGGMLRGNKTARYYEPTWLCNDCYAFKEIEATEGSTMAMLRMPYYLDNLQEYSEGILNGKAILGLIPFNPRSFKSKSRRSIKTVEDTLKCGCKAYEDVFSDRRWAILGYRIKKGARAIRINKRIWVWCRHQVERR